MPIFFHEHIAPEGEVGLWEIKEEEDWLIDQLKPSEQEQAQLNKIKGHRRSEWLAARLLIHKMSGRKERGSFLKDEFGKPYLQDSRFHISISHSRRLAAAIAGPSKVGIDIQQFVPKIERVTHKFLSNKETDCLDSKFRLWHLHVYWGAKEALYKAYGRRKLNFCNNIIIEPFSFKKTGGLFLGRILKDGYKWNYKIKYNFFEEYTMVYAIEEGQYKF